MSIASLQLTPEKDTTPTKRKYNDENTPPRVQGSKFFRSPGSSSSRSSASSPSSPLQTIFNSPPGSGSVTGSAEKRLRSFSLLTPPSPKAPAAAEPAGVTTARRKLFVAPLSDSEGEEASAGPCTLMLRMEEIRAIRFSQDSINFETSDSQTLDQLIESLSVHGWGRGYAPINIVEMPDGARTTLDNRRLYAVMRVLEKNPRFRLPVNIHRHTDKADKKTYLFPINRDAKSNRAVVGLEALKILSSANEIDAGSMGYCVYARMRVLTSRTPATHSYGFSDLPVVRKPV